MFNKITKYFIVLTGFIPIFLICWLVKTTQNLKDLSIYLRLDSISNICDDGKNLWKNHWLLIIFFVLLFISNRFLNFATKKIGALTVTVSSLKPAEVNFTTLLFSVLAGWLKYYFTDTKDLIFLIGMLVICLAYSLTFRDSYHYNLTYKIFFGYRYYEVQIDSITYLLISKRMIYKISEVTSVKKLTDYMLIDVSTKPLKNKIDGTKE